MPKPPAVDPRLLVHVGLGLRRLAPFAERMKVALAVWPAVDDGDDVVAGPGVAGPEEAALAAAQRATGSIPIVFTGVSEPVTRGFVQSLAHPGGNITGFANLEPSFGAKWLELLKEIAPNVQRVGVVFSPALSGAQLFYRSIEAAARNFSVKVITVHVQSPGDIEREIGAFGRAPNGSLINVPDGFSEPHREIFVAQAARYRLPAVYPFRSFARAGGLASYGNDLRDSYRQAAIYVDRILRGDRTIRPPGRATHAVRTDNQPQDGQSTGPFGAAVRPRAC